MKNFDEEPDAGRDFDVARVEIVGDPTAEDEEAPEAARELDRR